MWTHRQARRLSLLSVLAAGAALPLAAPALTTAAASAGTAARPAAYPVSNGHSYSQIQFMTDSSATQFNTNCNLVTGTGCVLPPEGPGHFYPYFAQARAAGTCVWEFGNMRGGNTFGKDKQYGKVGPHTMGAFAGAVRRNPSC